MWAMGNATIKQQQKEVSLKTKGQYMNELDSHTGIVINNILLWQILQSTKKIYIIYSQALQKVCA